jgi:ATP-binding cassette subfamily B multidrug efflux pump
MKVQHLIFKDFIPLHRYRYAAGLLTLICASVLQLAIPKLLGHIVDVLKYHWAGQSGVFWLTAGMLGLALVVFGLKYTWRLCLMGRARDLECFLRAKLFAHLQTLPVKFYHDKKTGDLMAYAINDLNAIRQAFAFGLVFLIDGIIVNTASLAVMARTIHPLLTLVAIAPLTAAIGLVFALRLPLRKRYTAVQDSFAAISEKIQENISGIRVVKAYVQEGAEVAKIEGASRERTAIQMDYVRLASLLEPGIRICFGASYALVLLIGSGYVKAGAISLGDFIAFNTYLAMLTRPVTNAGKIVEVWQRAMASMTRLNGIFAIQTDIVDDHPSHSEPRLAGSLEIRNLNFTYPGSSRRTLKDISLRLEAGQTLAIIGKTGSGKTTLVNLLLRLYPVERGRIFLDGVDINEIPLEVLRDNIGCVPQDNFLFSATIKQNIEFFKQAYTEEDVEEAARLSSVYDNIVEFPDRFETMVGERGITLSGGQKQRISIARAIIKDPAILILDDSLSAVDTRTEEEILGNIKRILKGRTGLIIAHRISTIKHADEIIVLDRGRIVERGTHRRLLKLKGHYYQLYRAQLAEARLETTAEETAL